MSLAALKPEHETESEARKRRFRHKRKHPLSLTPRPSSGRKCVYDIALDVVAPWWKVDYPGRERAWVQMSGQLPFVLKDVRHGKRPYDIPTIERLQLALEARAATMSAALEVLRAERDRLEALPPRKRGFCVVDPITGHDKRYRGRKRSATKRTPQK